MNDLISRQAEIDAIKALYEWHDTVTEDRTIDHLKRLPSAQPDITRDNDCNGCKFVGCYDTDFPCANCVRKDKDYYEPEG